MKKLKLIILFFAVFLISFVVFFPYRQFYDYLIKKNLQGQIEVDYNIKTASLLGVRFDSLKVNGENLGECSVSLTPVSFVISGKIADIVISRGLLKANFNVYTKDGFFIIKGNFPTRMLMYYLGKGYSAFIKDLKGKDMLYAKISLKKGLINIENLKISGDFELNGSGYINKAGLRFLGNIKIGKLKQKISL